MHTIKIRDLVPGGGYLAFDLRHVLEALGEPALESSWRIEGLWATDDTEAKQLESLADRHQRVSGRALKDAADNVVQVIDGRFTAFALGQDEPWVIVEAIDSSYYTVRSREQAILETIRDRFRDVSDYEYPDR
jgi:hypothetical protein